MLSARVKAKAMCTSKYICFAFLFQEKAFRAACICIPNGCWCSVSLKNLNKLSWTQKSKVGPALVLEFLLSDQCLKIRSFYLKTCHQITHGLPRKRTRVVYFLPYVFSRVQSKLKKRWIEKNCCRLGIETMPILTLWYELCKKVSKQSRTSNETCTRQLHNVKCVESAESFKSCQALDLVEYSGSGSIAHQCAFLWRVERTRSML